MGNILFGFAGARALDDEEVLDDEDVEDNLRELNYLILLLQIAERPMLDNPSLQMPTIRYIPDLRTFEQTMLYKEIKALCALPATSGRPNERWSLSAGLRLRENGLLARRSGASPLNLQRNIMSRFVPNNMAKRLMAFGDKLNICKFNQDGSRLVLASQGSVLHVFDSSRGINTSITRIKVRERSILEADFSSCGQYIVYSTWTDNFNVLPYNGREGDVQQLKLGINVAQPAILSVRFSPCGQYVVGGCNDSVLYVCNRETHAVRVIRQQRYQRADLNAISFISDQDPNMVVSGCDNGIVKLWDLRCAGNSQPQHNCNHCQCLPKPVAVFLGHVDGITYIDSRNDGRYILTNSKDQTIKIWDLRRATPSSNVNNKLILPLETWDYRWDEVPHSYDNPSTQMEGDASVMTYRGHRVSTTLMRARFSPLQQTGNRFIYTGCASGRIIIYDVLTGRMKAAIEGHKHIVRDLFWHPFRPEIVSCSWDYHVNLSCFKES